MNNHLVFSVLIASLLNANLTGCTLHRVAFGDCTYRIKTADCFQEASQDADIIASSYVAADSLIRDAKTLHPDHRLLITTIADIDNLRESSSLGRLIGEQLAARFTQRGYTVIEAKLHQGLIIVPRMGEFVLSRQLREMGYEQNISKVIAGTYAIGKDRVYVTLKMLDCKDGKAVSSHAYTLPIGPNTHTLLQFTG